MRRIDVIRTCKNCGTEFQSEQKDPKYCSQKCYHEYNVPWNKGKSVRLSPNSEFKKGFAPWNKGITGYKQPEGTGEKISKANIGKEKKKTNPSTIYNKKVRNCKVCGKEFISRNVNPEYCSRSCAGKTRKPNLGKKFSQEFCLKQSLAKKGKKTGPEAYQWIADRTKVLDDKYIRRGYKGREWTKSVFERDNYTCQECGNRGCKGNPVVLNSHHIIPCKKDISKAHDIDNGITLCKPCHLKTYGKEELFEEKYINIVKIKKSRLEFECS